MSIALSRTITAYYASRNQDVHHRAESFHRRYVFPNLTIALSFTRKRYDDKNILLCDGHLDPMKHVLCIVRDRTMDISGDSFSENPMLRNDYRVWATKFCIHKSMDVSYIACESGLCRLSNL